MMSDLTAKYHQFGGCLAQLSVLTTTELRSTIPDEFNLDRRIWGMTFELAIFYLVVANRMMGALVEMDNASIQEYLNCVVGTMKDSLIKAHFPEASEEAVRKLAAWFDTTLDLHARSYSELPLSSDIGGPDMISEFRKLFRDDLDLQEDGALDAQVATVLQPVDGSYLGQLSDECRALAAAVNNG